MGKGRIVAFLIVLLLVVGFLSIFTVSETQKAIKLQLGEIIRSDYEPGLHFKLPFINNVKKFDARIQTMDSKPERFLTSEKKNVIVDSFVKWRIKNVKGFYTTVAGDVMQANLRLDQIIKDELRSEFGKREIKDLISSDRKQIGLELIEDIEPIADRMGIELVDIRVKRIDLPPDVSTSVYQRMEAERSRVAQIFRSRGAEEAERIRANADRQREVILAEAFREAETLRGEGDAVAANIYAKTYKRNEEFFAFYRSLNAYQNTFGKNGLIVLEPDSDFFQYFTKENISK